MSTKEPTIAREGVVNPINALRGRNRKTPQQVLSQLERLYNHPSANEDRRTLFNSLYGEIEERLVNSGSRRQKSSQQILSQLERLYKHPKATNARKTLFESLYGEIEERMFNKGNKKRK